MKLRIVVTLFSIFLFSQSYAWGFWAHQRINRLAVFTLPPEMIDFYKENIEYITEHAVDPDKRRYAVEGEAPKHYIDLDHFCTYPCADFPRNYKDAVAEYSEDTLLAFGTVPWTIEQYTYRLTKAFEEKDFALILKYSADIGHYIGDSHVPLHTTENYNGQLTNQKGIHGFWESRLPELFNEEYDFFVGKAEYISNINEFVWDNVLEAHSNLETVLQEEKMLDNEFSPDQKYSYETRGQATVRTYSESYSTAYHNALRGMVEQQMQSSIKHVGDIWLTSWINAGQPDLNVVVSNKDKLKDISKIEKGKEVKSREHAETGADIFTE